MAWRERASPMNNQVGCSAAILMVAMQPGDQKQEFNFCSPRVAAEPCPPGRRVVQGGSYK